MTDIELKEKFNYVPAYDEKWCIYEDRFLIVISKNKRPKIYENSDGSFYEHELIF
jgi:hypothetical protein